MAQTDIELAVADLARSFDDDNQPVVVVNTWHANDRISALELTAVGRALARSPFWSAPDQARAPR